MQFNNLTIFAPVGSENAFYRRRQIIGRGLNKPLDFYILRWLLFLDAQTVYSSRNLKSV
jgi:hypothetical protein